MSLEKVIVWFGIVQGNSGRDLSVPKADKVLEEQLTIGSTSSKRK